ncbi:MAG TPA: WcbI family polysaccharide biosynthesis putative acetyltransferase [Pseudonocardia sp.]|jgi:hypothetical protein|nr:WcbI family polysaccharide biosynthesis putative acetyltransferase [Pseudonocardia sp.]
MDPGRRAHFADFYDGPPGDGPVAFVHGNCQAESLRILLSASPTFPFPTVRVPPAHELAAGDLPALDRLLSRTALLLSQPVREDYRGLPIGTGQLEARLGGGRRVVRWPVIRFTGLHPYSAIVRHPSDRSAVPPVVPYHDLRTLAVAAGRLRETDEIPEVEPDRLREVGADAVDELARRERLYTDVGVSDLLIGYGVDAAHTLNHPGNSVLVALARRVQEAVGAPADAVDPGRELLGGIRAPLERPVLEAWGLDAPGRPEWLVDGVPIPVDVVRRAQLEWYSSHPDWVEAGLQRHAKRLCTLGL